MTTLPHVLSARQAIGQHIARTPLLPSPLLSRASGAQAYLKLECWQRTGSFKIRGALAKVASLSPEERTRGLVTASAGNHGLGVAFAGQALGCGPITIFVPTNAPQAKVNHLQTFGCQVHQKGDDYDAAHALAVAHAHETGALYLSAYDDPTVIAGQGTVGLEILEDLPEADTLLVPVGGGGLIAGIALVAKALNPAIHIIGVQPDASPAAFLSLLHDRLYETYAARPTICDGLAGGFGRLPFELAQTLIDDILVVPEADVWQAVRWLTAHEQLLVEGSGAIAIAPLLNSQLAAPGQKVVAVLTGRNIDAALLGRILTEEKEPTARDDDPHHSL